MSAILLYLCVCVSAPTCMHLCLCVQYVCWYSILAWGKMCMILCAFVCMCVSAIFRYLYVCVSVCARACMCALVFVRAVCVLVYMHGSVCHTVHIYMHVSLCYLSISVFVCACKCACVCFPLWSCCLKDAAVLGLFISPPFLSPVNGHSSHLPSMSSSDQCCELLSTPEAHSSISLTLRIPVFMLIFPAMLSNIAFLFQPCVVRSNIRAVCKCVHQPCHNPTVYIKKEIL